MGIDKYTLSWRGSNIRKEIIKLETKWIYELLTTPPHGHNFAWAINTFISQDSGFYVLFPHLGLLLRLIPYSSLSKFLLGFIFQGNVLCFISF